MSDIPEHVTILRKRFIPNETTYLNKDTIYEMIPERIMTGWHTIKPRADIAGGLSAYYPERGIKLSRIYNHDHQLVYWYCDIIQMEYTPDNVYYEDLLLDVILMPDGQIKVMDADELASALEQSLITKEQACLALRRLNDFLTSIYDGSIIQLQQPILDLEKKLLSSTTSTR